jgi:hypothetical protein
MGLVVQIANGFARSGLSIRIGMITRWMIERALRAGPYRKELVGATGFEPATP